MVLRTLLATVPREVQDALGDRLVVTPPSRFGLGLALAAAVLCDRRETYDGGWDALLDASVSGNSARVSEIDAALATALAAAEAAVARAIDQADYQADIVATDDCL